MRRLTQGRWTAIRVAAAVFAAILLVQIVAVVTRSAQTTAGEPALESHWTLFLSGDHNGTQAGLGLPPSKRGDSLRAGLAQTVFLRLAGEVAAEEEAESTAVVAAGLSEIASLRLAEDAFEKEEEGAQAAASESAAVAAGWDAGLAYDGLEAQEPDRLASVPPPPSLSEDALEPQTKARRQAGAGSRMLDLGTDPRLVERLGGWRQMVQNLMAGRGSKAGTGAGTSRQQAIEVALLATSKPGNLVRRAAEGGKRGSFLPALMLSSLLRGSRPASGVSWLDRTTDAILDHLRTAGQGGRARASEVARRYKPWPTDECASALQIPKVAMLFLTKGELHHSATWELWFKYAQGRLPAAPVRAACAAGPDALEAARQACARRSWGTGEDVLGNQHLFSVYMHVSLNNRGFRGFPPDALWYRRDILERVEVEWGQHSLVTATRNLLRVALDDPLNARFIQLSEACVPLYPPTVLYHQLMSERKSRINACAEPWWERHERRWTDSMTTEHMSRAHWRKSSQWVGLTREHAQLVVDDTEIDTAFQQHCFPTSEAGRPRDCFSDEHYFATLLAVAGRENETDCRGFLVNTDWMRGGAHPRTYELQEVSAARLRLLRMPMDKCGYQSAIQSGASQFVQLEELAAGAGVCTADVLPYSRSLGPQCPLFARKFAPETAAAVTALLSECKHRLRIVHGSVCEQRVTRLRKYA